MAEKGKALPKFGEWDLKDPATADGFTVIFNKARNEKKTRATAPPPPSIVPQKVDTVNKPPPSPPKRGTKEMEVQALTATDDCILFQF
ncbi:hypothetical protein ES319_D12G212300v1 [Gossypium barbadense]|uniref:RIN4 pathogenic type III effector avirulence factor Avr cleavage site domain-containing protein n=1 Tax=Gossypium barbadense TaxID=3634 RepID=A0A5J5P131_GOSBA|nr:hypothetical protein ES319_D12G212300v1 [Gossypium barbadense]